jgi:hypothetical protein
MSKKTRQTILILLLVSIFLCACPGVFLVISGVEGLVDMLPRWALSKGKKPMWLSLFSMAA